MKEPPKEFEIKNKKYRIIEKTKQGLYLCERESGIKECFDAFDLGLIKPRGRTNSYNIRPEITIF